jgi:hypothetical protein
MTLRERDAEGSEDWDLAPEGRRAIAGGRHAGAAGRVSKAPSRHVAAKRSDVAIAPPGDGGGAGTLPGAFTDGCQGVRRINSRLYLAGVAYWSGAYPEAVGWGVRALRSPFAFQVLPLIVRLFSRQFRSRSTRPSVISGLARVSARGISHNRWSRTTGFTRAS